MSLKPEILRFPKGQPDYIVRVRCSGSCHFGRFLNFISFRAATFAPSTCYCTTVRESHRSKNLNHACVTQVRSSLGQEVKRAASSLRMLGSAPYRRSLTVTHNRKYQEKSKQTHKLEFIKTVNETINSFIITCHWLPIFDCTCVKRIIQFSDHSAEVCKCHPPKIKINQSTTFSSQNFNKNKWKTSK